MSPDSPDSTVPRDIADSGPAGDATTRVALDRALDLVRFLRANCDWDAAQTPHSLLKYLLEEAHETAAAVAAGDDAALASELGDLLLNVAFQIVLAEERGAFAAEDVVSTLEGKMRRRHPHLYGGGERVDWDTLKAQERDAAGGAQSLLHGVADGLDPLTRAFRLQERVATVGFDWPDATGAFDKVREEIQEVSEHLDRPASDDLEDEIGDLLFAVVNVARLSGVHPLTAMLRANAKFSLRFAALEEMAAERGVILGDARLEELEALWLEAKLRERNP